MNNDIPIEPDNFFGQMTSVLGGLFLLLSGAAIFYTIAYWRLHGQRVEAVLIGIRRRSGQYYNVYRYALPGGDWHEATAVQGTTRLQGRTTGRRVAIRVTTDHREEAHEPAANVVWALAFGLFLGGGWLTYASVTEYKHSIVTWIVVVTICTLAGRKLWRWLTRLLKSMQSQAGPVESWGAFPIEQAETLGLSPEPSRFVVTGARPGRTSAIFCMIGFATLAFSYIPIHRLLLLRSGMKAQGVVTRLDVGQSTKNHDGVYPEVDFTSSDGAVVHFLDRAGANPSFYKVGDPVTVLYQPGKQGTAMIDHGFRNWEPAAGLLILGTVFLGLGLAGLRGLFSIHPARIELTRH